MTADILNLRLARKRRERAAREDEAARKRRLHGETKAVREERRLAAEKAARDLEAHRVDGSGQASAGEPPREEGP
jgi:hypothetical protein